MSPEEIKELRKQLKMSARDLASALKADAEDVWAWENGERFPTKRFVVRMLQLKKQGGVKPAATAATAAPRAAENATAKNTTAMTRLSDPELWQIVRKLITHADLFAEVKALAQRYADPNAAPPPGK